MSRGKPLGGQACVMVNGEKIVLLTMNEKGECEYLVSKKEMEEYSKKIMEHLQKGVNSCSFDTL